MAIGLIGGGRHDHVSLQKLYKYIVNRIPNKLNVVIIPFASKPNEYHRWQRRVSTTFTPFGLERLQIIKNKTSYNDAKKAIKSSNVLYFTGGKPDLLIERLMEKELVSEIQSYEGHIFGYSAGALALSKECLITKDRHYFHTIIKKGLGLIPFSVDVHYNHRRRTELERLTTDRSIIALPNGTGLIIDNDKIIPFGDIFCFGAHSSN